MSNAPPAASRNDQCPTNDPPRTKGKRESFGPSLFSLGPWWVIGGALVIPTKGGSGCQAHLDGCRHLQGVLENPAAGVRRAAPLLELDGSDVFAFLVVEEFEERLGVFLADLGRRATHENEGVRAVIEDRHRTPALGLGFGLDEHW